MSQFRSTNKISPYWNFKRVVSAGISIYVGKWFIITMLMLIYSRL